MVDKTFLLKRALISSLLLAIASLVVFAGIRASVDPTARLRTSKDQNAVPREKIRLHLNENIFKQYGRWVGELKSFNLGKGDIDRELVTTKLSRGIKNTFELVIWGMIVAGLLGIAFGVIAAINRNNFWDFTFSGFSFLGAALPTFFFGYVLIDIFTTYLPDLFTNHLPHFLSSISNIFGSPGNARFKIDSNIGGHFGRASDGSFTLDSFITYIRNLTMPVMVLAIQLISTWSRYQRSSMIEALQSDYNRTALAKGMSKKRVYMKHAFRNAQLPMITIIALDLGALMGGLIVTEFIFSLKGMGFVFINALSAGDATTLTGWTMLVALFVVSANFFADLLYTVIDPRIRT